MDPGFTFPVTGAFRFDPVFLLMRARPLAVRPPFLDLHPFLIPHPFIAPFFLEAIVSGQLGGSTTDRVRADSTVSDFEVTDDVQDVVTGCSGSHSSQGCNSVGSEDAITAATLEEVVCT